jgi:hypothetical protein
MRPFLFRQAGLHFLPTERDLMFVRVFFAAALLVNGTAALAQEASPAPSEPVKEKKICRALAQTGSIMSKRKCMTKAEWAQFNAENQKQAENFRDRQSNTGGTSSSTQ